MSRDDENSTEIDASEAEKHSADLLEPLAGPERRAVLDSLITWCQDRPVDRSDVADMIDFHFGAIDQEELMRRSDVAAQKAPPLHLPWLNELLAIRCCNAGESSSVGT